MYATPAVIDWHRDHFGPPDKFGYKDFIPLFKAEQYDPVAWAALFKRAGARYVVPVAEHHDGFAMYDSALTKWNAKDMGPHRDLIGELADATRKGGIGLRAFRTSHGALEFHVSEKNLQTDLYNPADAEFYGPPQPPAEHAGRRNVRRPLRPAKQSILGGMAASGAKNSWTNTSRNSSISTMA